MAKDLAAIAVLLALALLDSPAPAPEFSADIVGTAPGAPARLYVAGDKARIETPEAAGGFFLVDGGANAAYFVKPAQRVFMAARQSSRLTRIFVPLDPADPCRQWRAMAETAGAAAAGEAWRCERLDRETIDGRETIRYRLEGPGQPPLEAWVAPVLRLVVRLVASDGSALTLRHVAEAPQPAGLFVIPADYRLFDPARLIERIKQSDVWVEPTAKSP